MALALPKLRWLIIGAIAAGVWVAREDAKGPRPPQNVPATKSERGAEAKPRPQKPLVPKAAAERPAVAKSAIASAERPVPPKPVTGKPIPQKVAERPAPQQTALLLPRTVDRPPAKPQKIVTGSITKWDRPTFVQTTTKVRVRAQAKPDAAVIATLEPRTVVRELARSGDWLLVLGDGRKGWVCADYVAKPPVSPRRPKLPITEQAKAASAKAGKAQ
jgi:hypothetical protein